MIRKLKILWLYFKVMRKIKRKDYTAEKFVLSNFLLQIRYIEEMSIWQIFLREDIDECNSSYTEESIPHILAINTNKVWDKVFKHNLKSSVVS